MPRVRKQEEYIKKKEQIIICAIELLDEIGYERFSVNKVIERAEMTKGAFFHYFDSKNELIEEIINLLQLPLVQALEEIANDNKIKPRQKILYMADSIKNIKGKHSQTVLQLTNLLQKKENKSIADMVAEKSIELFLPIYEKVLVEGNKCEQFDIAYPNGSAFIYFSALFAIKKEIGIVMGNEKIDDQRYLKLIDKIRAFEAYANDLFNLDAEMKIIDEKLFEMNKNR